MIRKPALCSVGFLLFAQASAHHHQILIRCFMADAASLIDIFAQYQEAWQNNPLRADMPQ